MRTRLTPALEVEALESRVVLSSFFVDPTGNDQANGSAATPWKTLQHAADTVQAGDTVTVQPGTYTGFELDTSGTAASPIRFLAQPGTVINQPAASTGQDGIILEGASFADVEGFTVNGMTRAGFRCRLNDHATIRGNATDNNGEFGIFTSHSDNVLIENNVASNSHNQHGIYISNECVNPVARGNTCFGNALIGIHMNGDLSSGAPGIITGALIENNVLHDNGTNGINCDGVQSSVFRNNLIYNNLGNGISLNVVDAADGSKNNVVVNNTISVPAGGRWAITIKDTCTGNTVSNNILLNAGNFRGSITLDGNATSGFTSNNNSVVDSFSLDDGNTALSLAEWRAATGQDTASALATPTALFVNAAANDFHLKTGSPAIDAGTATNAPPTDIEGKARPLGAGFDIGAYEFGTATAFSQVFVIGQNNLVYAQALDDQGAAVGTPTLVIGGQVKAVASVRDGTGQPELFVIGQNNQVYGLHLSASGQAVGGYFLTASRQVKALSVAHTAAGNPEVFVIGLDDNQVYAQVLDATGSTSGGYFRPANGVVKGISATQDASGNPLVFAIGQNGYVYAQNLNAAGTTSSGYFLVGGGQVLAVAAGRTQAGNPLLLAVGKDGQVYRQPLDGTGHGTGGYVLTRGGRVKSLSVGQDAAGLPIAYVIGLDSQVYAQKLTATGQTAGAYTRVFPGTVKPTLVGASGTPTTAELDAFFADNPLAASGDYLGFGVL